MLRRTRLRALVSLPEKTVTQAQIVGWSHLPFGKFDNLDLEALAGQATTAGLLRGVAAIGIRRGAVFIMGGSAVTSCVSILEAAR